MGMLGKCMVLSGSKRPRRVDSKANDDNSRRNKKFDTIFENVKKAQQEAEHIKKASQSASGCSC
jgi:hypothetical protein